MAERINGILKNVFYLYQTFANGEHAKVVAKNAINTYNEIKLYLSLNTKAPNMVYTLTTKTNFNL
jgi:putative transposase